MEVSFRTEESAGKSCVHVLHYDYINNLDGGQVYNSIKIRFV